MITQDYCVLTPAYGRDYRSSKLAIADFVAGKDFVLNNYNGSCYCSVRDFQAGITVNIRYDHNRKVVPCKVGVTR